MILACTDVSTSSWGQYISGYIPEIETPSVSSPILDPISLLSASTAQSSALLEVQLTDTAMESYVIDTADGENSGSNNGTTSSGCLVRVPYSMLVSPAFKPLA